VKLETERSFDGKLCQKYSYQNYQNLVIGFQVTAENVGDVFLRHSVDVFERNLAGGLNFTSYIQLYLILNKNNIQYGDDCHFVFLHKT